MPEPKEKAASTLKKIRSGALSRGLALARVSLGAGARAASHAISNVMGSGAAEDVQSRKLAHLKAQLTVLAKELGSLKGSVMKVGQMLSLYGEHFLPPEVNVVLKSLQSQSPPVAWKEMEKVLKRQLPPERLAELEIEQTSMAAASLGQVHRARRKSDGKLLALKIQYPGVEKAIESDIRALKGILNVSKLIPGGPRYDALFDEVRDMLKLEVDYRRELASTQVFREFFRDTPELVLPEVFPEYSNKRVIATSLEMGEPIDSPRVRGLPQQRRDRLARIVLEEYFREFYRLHQVQTDPHFGNYRIRIDDETGPGQSPEKYKDQLIMFDFGAVRKFSDEFVRAHSAMLRGSMEGDVAVVRAAAERLGFMRPDDPPELVQKFYDFCVAFLEPFASDTPYDWGASDLPKRIMKDGMALAMGFKLRAPPQEVVFLDRKIGGVFIFLQVLGARVAGREILLRHLPD
jgi:predicted unusual protein kinase regulating ubiquinone biosynthesis (AarF/ABC1/UbiB family)